MRPAQGQPTEEILRRSLHRSQEECRPFVPIPIVEEKLTECPQRISILRMRSDPVMQQDASLFALPRTDQEIRHRGCDVGDIGMQT